MQRASFDTGSTEKGWRSQISVYNQDNTVPESVTRATLKQYRHSEAVTDILEFADRSHSLTIDSGWREVANACLAWLRRQSL